jgi:hypothetical protein
VTCSLPADPQPNPAQVSYTVLADTTPPPTPSPEGPNPDGVTLTSRTVTLDWTAVTDSGGSGLDLYRVRVTYPSGAENTFSVQAPTSSDTTTFPTDGLYRWTVRSRDNAGLQSPFFSPERTFRIAVDILIIALGLFMMARVLGPSQIASLQITTQEPAAAVSSSACPRARH